MTQILKLIQGSKHSDKRGTLYFINDFDMRPVKRMYMIVHEDITMIRGWRGHKLEQRWFYVVEGSFEFKLVKIDNWKTPSVNLEMICHVLSSDEPQILHVPTGFASHFRALANNSKVLVYADAMISESMNDDYQYPTNYFDQ